MNSQQRAAMQMALEALEEATTYTASTVWSPSMTKECEEAATALREALNTRSSSTHSDAEYSEVAQPQCNQHPDAPHGFNRNASHNADRYVCECESWEQPQDHIANTGKLIEPQGNPIGWTAAKNLVDDGYGHSFTVISSEPASPNESYVPVYATPPVVQQGDDDLTAAYMVGYEKGKDYMKERCAKVCEARYMGDNNREDMEAKACAAAIRSMK